MLSPISANRRIVQLPDRLLKARGHTLAFLLLLPQAGMMTALDLVDNGTPTHRDGEQQGALSH